LDGKLKKNTSAGFDYYFIHTKGDDGDDKHHHIQGA
jgi:hypothetical protein